MKNIGKCFLFIAILSASGFIETGCQDTSSAPASPAAEKSASPNYVQANNLSNNDANFAAVDFGDTSNSTNAANGTGGGSASYYEMPMAAFRDGARGLKQKIADFRDVVVVFGERNNDACAEMLEIVKRQAQSRGIPTLMVFPSTDEQIAYGIGNFPTTVLFLKGEEKQRWLREYRDETFSREFAKQFPSTE